jgi:hypothetical protein
MRSHFTVLAAPIFHLRDGVVQIHEPVLPEAFEPCRGLEGFDGWLGFARKQIAAKMCETVQERSYYVAN